MSYISLMDHKYIPLLALYSFYEDFTKGFPVKCSPGCSTCCTVNVAATTLETAVVRKALSNPVPEETGLRIARVASAPRYIPTTTLNRNTWEIIRGKNITPDEGEPGEGFCPLLDDQGFCSVYESRPFACRALSSTTLCKDEGMADMEPFLVTVNLAMYQIIEHLDSNGGITENFSGLLHSAITGKEPLSDKNRKNTDQLSQTRNCPLPGFMIPPDDKLRFRSFLRRLSAWPVGEDTLAKWLPEEMPIY